jgi:predicted 3-demethylubiquinone-9 3-methyltransferase (glyoxalase superfamily)
MTISVTPFLMFQGDAADAIAFYLSLFPDSQLVDLVRWGPGQAGAEGSVMIARFRIGGQTVRCIDSAVEHDFSFTPAFSFFVECRSEEEIGALAAALSEGGAIFMPLGAYDFARRFAWVGDRFGVSWQLALS